MFKEYRSIRVAIRESLLKKLPEHTIAHKVLASENKIVKFLTYYLYLLIVGITNPFLTDSSFNIHSSSILFSSLMDLIYLVVLTLIPLAGFNVGVLRYILMGLIVLFGITFLLLNKGLKMSVETFSIKKYKPDFKEIEN